MSSFTRSSTPVVAPPPFADLRFARSLRNDGRSNGSNTRTTRYVPAEATVPVSRDPQRAADLARELGADTSASSLEQLLRSPDIDAVYVGSPNSVHHDQAMAALRAGKHVLVEKPAVPTATLWVQLVDKAREAGVVLLEGIRNE